MRAGQLGKPIARGRTAEIFAWGDGQVLKLFHNWFDRDSIEYEQRIARAISAAGIPAPAAGEILQVNGRDGLVYERVDGLSMWDVLARQPQRFLPLARLLASLHAGMHAGPAAADLPSQRSRLEHKLRGARPLPEPLRETLSKALADLPEGDRICHGDFHPGNVLVGPERTVIIDWIDATRGSPLADVARTTVIALGAAASSQVPDRLRKILVRLFHSIYLDHYFRLCPGGRSEYRRWLPIMAGARLSEEIPEVESWLLTEAQKGNSAGRI